MTDFDSHDDHDAHLQEPSQATATPAPAPDLRAEATLTLAEFEEQTLYDALLQFLRAPLATLEALWWVARPQAPPLLPDVTLSPALRTASAPPSPPSDTLATADAPPPDGGDDVPPALPAPEGDWRVLAGYLVAFLLALYGTLAFVADDPVRRESVQLANGTPFVLLGVGLWLAVAVWEGWLNSRRKPKKYADDAPEDPQENAQEEAEENVLPPREGIREGLRAMLSTWEASFHPLRLAFALAGAVLAVLVWLGSAKNELSTGAFYAWLACVLLWVWAFAPRHWWHVRAWMRDAWRSVRAMFARPTTAQGWLFVALAVAILAGAYYLRAVNFYGEPFLGGAVPPEMTSDHVEKILDAQRVKEGSRNIFFANNGGREPFQMYALALLSVVTGQAVNYDLLKTLAILESLITLPVFFWLGRVVAGERGRWATIFAWVLVGALAMSYWHLTITRLSLRIVLTPLVTALLLIALIKAIRTHHIRYYLWAGVVLGFGLYTYQAVRMLPVVAIVAFGLAWLASPNWRTRWQTLFNAGALVLVAFMAFVPLFHYSLENPDQFWRRTAGRLLGDEIVEERLPDGRVVERVATFGERLEAFGQNVPVLMDNLRNAALMFNWKGDVAWINNFPNYPALDAFTGAFFLLGWAAWGVWLLRARDASRWLIVLTLPIMLLPSALSLAYPIENPSFTRSSGAMPSTLLLASLPCALLIEQALRLKRVGRGLAALLLGVVVVGGTSQTTTVYFTKFPTTYADASLPYSDAGRVLRTFATLEGGYGNAFMIAYPYWWDHRAVGLAGGIEGKWENGVYDNDPTDDKTRAVDYVPIFMRQAFSAGFIRHRYDPERPLLFFYAPPDIETENQLKLWFPQGQVTRYPSYQRNDEFMVYRVPPLGVAGFAELLQKTNTP